MAAVAIGGLAVLAVLGLLYAFAHARPAAVRASLVWGFGTLGAAGFALMLFTGRGASAIWALVMFGPALRQAWKSWRARKTFSRPGDTSGVETATLEMRLDLGTGMMSGQVRRGDFAGRNLASMDLPELRALLADCQANDAESVPLLEAWLDRVHPEWRDAPGSAPPPSGGGPMTRAEALAVLGLREGAGEEEIRTAHRRLMQSAHPDRGGSDWLASRINEARDLLLP
ncbi:molecular chaperone DnaJ [Roseococcus sp. SYP-B2431]|uniref:molecular chaperone DnaJ n=1 Tax=Roseococcus sp. SYP-B2431 TaxID=2496640 RepID=UPI0010390827|nr:molecular chaperone DnaJ [Roseococcus sp. SYP-B2431]TCI00985.1 molecular chaperone DnaJ [Roseococcus sp. SYP-B2431]